MSNRIELERSFIITELDEKRIKEKIEKLRTRKINDNYLELTYKPKSTEETEKYEKKRS